MYKKNRGNFRGNFSVYTPNYLSMMQSLDPNTLFSIFEQGDEHVYREHGVEDVLNNPYVLIGMVIKGVQNYYIMDMMYLRQYPEQYKNVRELTKRKYFNNLFKYLQRINIDEVGDAYSIGSSYEVVEAYHSLTQLRKFYEDAEEYEKCAVIQKFVVLLDNE